MQKLSVLLKLVAVIVLSAVLTGPAVPQEPAPIPDFEIAIPPTIRTVEFTGNTIFTSDQLRDTVNIRSGQLLTEPILRDAVTNIRKLYTDQGYFIAITDITFPQPGEVGALRFILEEVRVAEIRITGLRKTREDVIRRMLVTVPGQLYNRKNIERDIAKLQSLGLFDTIDPQIEFATPGEAVITWNLEEREKQNYIEVGGSIGQPEGLVGRVALTLSNIGGRADTLRVQGLFGAVESQVGGRVSYFNPYIGPKNTSLNAEAYSTFLYRFNEDVVDIEGEDSDRYFERRTGAQVTASRTERTDLTLSAGLRYDSIDTNNLPPQIFTEPFTSLDSTVLLANALAVRDRRNSIEYPSEGTLTSMGVDLGTADLEDGGSGGIGKLTANRRWYSPLAEPQPVQEGTTQRLVPVLAYRVLAGGSFGDLPFSEQFFIGGVGGFPLRGYLEDRFWGKYIAGASAEYRKPFSSRFIGVAFVDAGDAWNSDYQISTAPGVSTDFRQHTSFSPKVGAGVGFRYRTPFGPLSLDFAYGEEFRIHFNVGTSF